MDAIDTLTVPPEKALPLVLRHYSEHEPEQTSDSHIGCVSVAIVVKLSMNPNYFGVNRER